MNTEDFYERALSEPGAISVVILLSVLLPLFNIFPKTITIPLILIFSIPVLYIFLAQVILNRSVSLKKNLLIAGVASYFFYLLSAFPFDAVGLYVHTFFFALGGGISIIAYLIYYLLYRTGKKIKYGEGELSYRWRFLLCFLPTLLITLAVCLFLSMLIGPFAFGLEKMLVGA